MESRVNEGANELPRSESEKSSVVDVEQAQQVFEELQHNIETVARKEDMKVHPKDVEMGPMGPSFDIQSFFEDSVRRAQEVGHTPKKMGVVVKGLTVVGMGSDASTIPDNLDILKSLWPPNWFAKKKGTPFDILHDVSAFCRGGEMLLVLGRPGAGCSSFLRVVANQRAIFTDVKGDVTYGGIPAGEFSQYAGEAIYTPEEDMHYPTLTLKQTLTFALRTKTPGQLFSGHDSKRQFRQYMLDGVTKMFGLVNQIYTLVGNEFVRGLSGGERKRATIAEAMVSRGAIDCWDCSTRGLDAASALDYAKSLRVITNALHKVTLASFYQASESIYQQFDRVLVLDKGRCIYFGRASEAKQYFLDLGFECEDRKSTPDFLTGVTNPLERRVRSGFENTAPQNSVAFETAYKQSDHYARAMEELQGYEKEIEQTNPKEDFLKQLKSQKAKRARESSKYSASIFEQVSALTVRQAQIFWGDKLGIIIRYFSVIYQAFLVGSVFYNMQLTSEGAYSRGGALFVTLLLNVFLNQSSLFTPFTGRGIMQKQKSYAMYHPFAFHLAEVAVDIPVLFVQSLLYSVISYWLFGFDADAHKFFTFLAINYVSSLCINNLLRLLGNISPSVYVTQQLFGVLFVMIISYTGYYIPYSKIPPWLAWLYWLIPNSYGFKAIFTSQMRGLVFDCTETGYVPYGPSYNDSAHRVCTVAGAEPGATLVTGEQYVTTVYDDISFSHTSLDIGVIVLFWLGFIVANCLALEKIQWLNGGFILRIFKAGRAPKMNDDETEAEAARKATEAADNMKFTDMNAGVFLWDDICYTVPVQDNGDGNKTRLLLDNVSGWIKPGQMTALMGSSGAGKTTLLDVLVKRKTQGTVTGTMLLNGLPLRIDYERITGYVEQMDVHNPFLTVREALQFSAKLRQEFNTPMKEKMDYVERVLEMMEMTHLGDALVGDLTQGYGISVEERKRLTIGMELVAKPHILFLDEPTSGLDAQSSYNIIKFIRKLANAGMPLICTIHQPSPVLFEYFDRLLLLAKGGKVAYFGDIGDQSKTLLSYFEKNGARHCEEYENPAEYILEVIGAGVSGKAKQDWVQVWRDSAEASSVREELKEMQQVKPDSNLHEKPATEFATSKWYQTKLLYQRMNLIFWRNPSHNVGRIMQGLIIGLFVGFTYWKIGNSTSDIGLRVFAIFLLMALGIMMIGAAMPQFTLLRDFFKRDYSSKFYSAMPFSLTVILVELPYLLFVATLCMICCYWSTGLSLGTALDGFYFWIGFVVLIIYCHTVGVLVAAGMPNLFVAILFYPVINSLLFLLSGVFNPERSLPTFWRSWMYPLDPFHYFLEGLVSTALAPLVVECNDKDFFRFSAPANQTCGEYMSEFLTYGTGYIGNPDSSGSELCKYCLYKDGGEYLDTLGWTVENRWRDFGILCCYFAFNIILAIAFVRIFRKQRR